MPIVKLEITGGVVANDQNRQDESFKRGAKDRKCYIDPLHGFRGGAVAGILSYLSGERASLRDLNAAGHGPQFRLVGLDVKQLPHLETVFNIYSKETEANKQDLSLVPLADYSDIVRATATEFLQAYGAQTLHDAVETFTEQVGLREPVAPADTAIMLAGLAALGEGRSQSAFLSRLEARVGRLAAGVPEGPLTVAFYMAVIARAVREPAYYQSLVAATGKNPLVPLKDQTTTVTTHQFVQSGCRTIIHGAPGTLLKNKFDVYVEVDEALAERIQAGPMIASYGDGGTAVPTVLPYLDGETAARLTDRLETPELSTIKQKVWFTPKAKQAKQPKETQTADAAPAPGIKVGTTETRTTKVTAGKRVMTRKKAAG